MKKKNNFSFKKRSLFIKPPPPKVSKKPWVWFIIKGAFRRTLMFFGALFFISLVLSIILSMFTAGQVERPLPKEFVLYLPLSDSFIEHPNQAASIVGTPQLTIRQAVDTLDRASHDRRVKGLVLSLEGGSIGLANLQEFRAALLRFRETGRFAYIYGTSYGRSGGGLSTYYLASAFDQIWMQPVGTVSIAGISAEIPFARALLDKVGVRPQFYARKEYKNLFESLTSSHMSEATRESMNSLITDLGDQLTDGIEEQRGFSHEEMQAIIDKGLLLDTEAQEAGLVDELADFSTLWEQVSIDLTGQPDSDVFVYFDDYEAKTRGAPPAGIIRKRHGGVALVYAVGTILSQGDLISSSADAAPPLGDEMLLVAEDIADDLHEIAVDPNIKTVVLRIDSPGGSPAASETIRLALLKVKEEGKILVVSMGGTCASGGYWIASPADYIFALPATLTGSIGVAGGKFVLQDMWDKLGVNWESVEYGENAGLWSFNRPFSEKGEARINAMMDRTYDAFIERVAEGRGMSKERADEVAGGRVWTGAQAVEHGLVDELGGLDAALDYAAIGLGLPNHTALDLAIYPRVKTPIERLMEFLSEQASMAGTLKDLSLFNTIRARPDILSTYEPVKVH